jgi:hypothetical protein
VLREKVLRSVTFWATGQFEICSQKLRRAFLALGACCAILALAGFVPEDSVT